MSKLLSSIKIGDLTLKNRIVMSPMCQYSAIDGFANDWHLVHYGSRAVGGCGAIIQEATAVSPEGRITYGDLGIWSDEHIAKLSEVVGFIEMYGAVPGIQLAHAGRKGSCELPWKGGEQIKKGENRWTTVAPSPLAFHTADTPPKTLSPEAIRKIVDDFASAARRAVNAGYKIIEIHAAHGYLIHQFLSPLSNRRLDNYGGSFENRIRFLLEIVNGIKPILPEGHSLWVRISATEWVDDGWNLEESTRLTSILKEHGVNVIDVSTGGNLAYVKIPVSENYQVPFAEVIKKQTYMMTGALGLITDAHQAEDILEKGFADLIIMGRQLLREPYFPHRAAHELGDDVEWPVQYQRAKR